MMCSPKGGCGFGGTVNYALDIDGRNDKDARILYADGVDVYYDDEGQLAADPKRLSRSFRAQAMMNPGVRKCVKHLWMSYRPEDQLVMVNNASKRQYHFNTLEDAIAILGHQRVEDIIDKAMVEDAKRLLKKMKYDLTQFLIVRHSEKDNPHVHIILNMVDNEGVRLNDFQEKKRIIKICQQITTDRNYTWGKHKSTSEVVANNPKEKARAEICKQIFDISRKYHSADELWNEAARRGIEVKFSTNYQTGHITGISFSKDGYIFPAGRVDASLSAQKLFPSQGTSPVSLSELPIRAQNIVKAGGIVKGFNDQILHGAVAPELPQSVRESKTRDEYHKAIERAEKTGNRSAYILNIAALALDSKCGPSENRAEDVSPYIFDNQMDSEEKFQNILDIVRIADEEERQRKSLFQRFLDFLRNLIRKSLNFIMFSIPAAQESPDTIQWSEFRDAQPGKVVGLATEVQLAIERAYQNQKESQSREQNWAPGGRTGSQTPMRGRGQAQTPTAKPSPQKESKNKGKPTKRIKISKR